MAQSEENVNATLAAARRRTSRRLLITVLSVAALAVVAGTLVIFVIPGLAGSGAAPAPQETNVSAVRCGPDATPEACPERQQFIDAARLFTTEVKPQLVAVSLSAWAANAWAQIEANEQAANDAFAATRYIDALMSMQATIEQGREQILRAQTTFAEALAEAEQLLTVGDAPAAQQAINLAVTIDPAHAEALALAKRIAVLPEVLGLLEAASVARVENRQNNEVKALQSVLKLDPERRSAAARLAELAEGRRELRFSNAVRAAEQALQDGEFTAARKAYQRAQDVGLGRDLSSLLGRIEAAAKSARIQQLINTAQAHVRNDTWAPALQAFNQVLALEPVNAAAVEGRAQAQPILDAMNKLKPFIDDPLRATDQNIQAGKHNPANLLESLAPLQGKSARLDAQAAQLRQTLTQAQQTVSVRVISDGKTDIRVLRIGQVGKHREKIITLKPGNYKLEGARSGYHNVVVPLQIPLGATSAEVTVLCREQI